VWTTVIVLLGFAIREFLDTGPAPRATESPVPSA
jgi:hypothetical protein